MRKITKIYIFWWFSTTLWSPTFPIHSRPIYLYRSSCPDKISDNPRPFFVIKILKNTKMFHVFGSSNKRKFGVFLIKNDPTWPASARIVRQKHRTNFSSTLTQFLSKCWSKCSSCFLVKTNVFEFFCEHFQSQPFENHNTIYQAAGHLPEHILRIINLQKSWKLIKLYDFCCKQKYHVFSKKMFQKYRMMVLESTLGVIERHRRSRAVIWTD